MTKLKIKTVFSDKENETLYKNKIIKVDGKSISTPIIAYDMSLIRNNEQLAPISMGLNEIYQLIDTEKIPINKLMSDTKAEKAFDNRLQTKFNKTNFEEDINICILESGNQRYPSSKENEYILSTAYLVSDIIPLPNYPNITNKIDSDSLFSKYKDFLKTSISQLDSFKGEKPVLGAIPKLSWTNTEELVEFYIERGINAFYVDFAARNSITAKRDFLHVFNVIKKNGILDQTFTYAYNVNPGRTSKKAATVPAKDVLSFGFGFDAMGRKHKRMKATSDVWKKINTLPNRIRIFNKNDYGYHKFLDFEKISKIYPSDSCISEEKIKNKFLTNIQELRRCENLLNIEQLGLEAFRLRQIIKSERPVNYLSDKTYVKPTDIKAMKKFKDSISGTRIDEYF